MRIPTKLVLVLMGAICIADPLGARSAFAIEQVPKGKTYQKFVPGTKITLKPRKAKYFLGENILLDYQISYEGEGALFVWTVTGLGTDDCRVIVTDQENNEAPPSSRVFYATGQGGGPVRGGDSTTYTIPLVHYCQLERPGIYRIRAAHNLRWSKRDPLTGESPVIPKDDPRWAETTIEVSMPDDAEARQVVEDMRRRERDIEYYRHLGGVSKTVDYADFACLHHPVYLPILEELATAKPGDKRAILGISHMPTPEATEALIRLLKDADKDRVRRIISALCDRLPDPPEVNRRDRKNPIPFEDAAPQQKQRPWRSDFAVPIRQFARKMLTEDDPTSVRCAAYILEAVGTREDMPGLVAAASRLVSVLESTEPPRFIEDVARLRNACLDVTHATAALVGRGAEPSADPRTPGEIMHFILMVKQQKDFRPGGWEQRCLNWVQNGMPYMREFVLFNFPRPLPESLLERYREGVRQVIGTTRELTVIHAAVQCALELTVPVNDLLAMLVERLDSDEPQLYGNLFVCLANLLETGTHHRTFGRRCTLIPDKKEMAAVKAAWKQFLQEQGQAIRNGKHFDRRSPEVLRSMYDYDR